MADQQSPINIIDRDAVQVYGSRLDVQWSRGVQRFDVSVEADGHRFHPHDRNSVRLGADQFHLENVHFHRPSEHWVDGARQEAELHAVHIRADEGVRLCVLAVFLTVEAGGGAEPPESFDLHALLPGDGSFYRYEGSLTTPGFDETVSWVVMKDRVPVSDARLAGFIRTRSDKARVPQRLNRRFVLSSS
ncbi:carbonic anhydrase [Saccharothrix tamanrassetensis]|uniref:carbonic anhydrase n=1 Tax=Saccharothrix tamanrassetensis TaxID=1051531 RepID=A0A841CAH1_9PSEU|nr:carbonic anhydrase family protein [Saccharothrix tamanrassetensis]MBB5954191.1 carbonic anhydrase [Saccharothrix tamanrassetensis]